MGLEHVLGHHLIEFSATRNIFSHLALKLLCGLVQRLRNHQRRVRPGFGYCGRQSIGGSDAVVVVEAVRAALDPGDDVDLEVLPLLVDVVHLVDQLEDNLGVCDFQRLVVEVDSGGETHGSHLLVAVVEGAAAEVLCVNATAETLGSLDDLELLHAGLLEDEVGHETRHATANNGNVLVLGLLDVDRSDVLLLEELDAFEPGAERVDTVLSVHLDARRLGVSSNRSLLQLFPPPHGVEVKVLLRATTEKTTVLVTPGRDTAARRYILGDDPDETGLQCAGAPADDVMGIFGVGSIAGAVGVCDVSLHWGDVIDVDIGQARVQCRLCLDLDGIGWGSIAWQGEECQPGS